MTVVAKLQLDDRDLHGLPSDHSPSSSRIVPRTLNLINHPLQCILWPLLVLERSREASAGKVVDRMDDITLADPLQVS